MVNMILGTPIDEDITPSHTHNDPLLDIQGPITRARVRQLNLEVSSFLSNSLYDFKDTWRRAWRHRGLARVPG
jgi:hypothetical protein